MSGRWMFRLWMTVGLLFAAWSAAQAAPPWGNLLSVRSVDADPAKPYLVTEENGPWMIMACTFSGDGADKQAKELVLELRKRYKLPAYIYQGRFDPGEAPARGFDKYGNPRKANYWKYKDEKDKEKARHPEVVEVAVLVGNLRASDDPKGQTMLRTIKYATPQCLDVKDGKTTHQTLTGWRLAQQQVYEMIGSEKKKLGPMRHAIIAPNPILPPDYFNQKGVDEETIALNKGVPYSLLECKGKYTVQVATFKGSAVIKQSAIQDIQEGRSEMGSQLAAAAQKADALAAELRNRGYDAYQYHDRFTSIVTVGSFDSPGQTLPNGQIDFDPEIRKVIEVFRAKPAKAEDTAKPELQTAYRQLQTQGLDPRALAVAPEKINLGTKKSPIFVPFDVQPVLVQAPKRPFSLAMGDRE